MSRAFQERIDAVGGLRVPGSAGNGKVALSNASGDIVWANPTPTYVSRAYRAAALNTANNVWTKVALDTKSFDPSGSMDVVTNNRYVCPVAGYYHVAGQLNANATAAGQTSGVAVYKNGALYTSETAISQAAGPINPVVSDIIQCNAGDTLELWALGSVVMALGVGSNANFLSIGLLTGVSVLPTGSTLVTQARSYRNAALNTAANAWTKITLDTKSYDAGSNFDGTFRYVVPATGYYSVTGLVNCTATAIGQRVITGIYKNGALVVQGDDSEAASATGGPSSLATDVISCQAGDTLELYVYTTAVLALFVGGGMYNYLTVRQVGGVNLSAALSPTAQTADYTAGPGQQVLMTGAHTVTLPNAPLAGCRVDVVALTGKVVVNRQGTDTFTIRGTTGITTLTIASGMKIELMYFGGAWYFIGGALPIVPSPWTAATLLNLWAAQGAITPGYMKDANGFVHLRGRLSTAGGGVTATVVFTLPAGFRPGQADGYAIGGLSNTNVPGGAEVIIDNASGNVTIYFAAGLTDIGLGGVNFLAEN